MIKKAGEEGQMRGGVIKKGASQWRRPTGRWEAAHKQGEAAQRCEEEEEEPHGPRTQARGPSAKAN